MAVLDSKQHQLPPIDYTALGRNAIAETDHEKAFEALLKTSTELKPGAVVGAMIRFQVADGYAFYLVTKERPLTIRHVSYSDGYQISDAHIRGLTKRDVLLQVQQQKAQQKFFDTRTDYFTKLKVGQVIHYSHGFGSFVRCKVVNVDGKNLLQPIALVGGWDKNDLVSRDRTGKVHYGYFAERVVNGTGAWQPSDTCIWECPSRTIRVIDSKGNSLADPRTLEPINLEIPMLSPTETETAKHWVLVERAHEALSKSYEDKVPLSPLTMINRAKAILAEVNLLGQ